MDELDGKWDKLEEGGKTRIVKGVTRLKGYLEAIRRLAEKINTHNSSSGQRDMTCITSQGTRVDLGLILLFGVKQSYSQRRDSLTAFIRGGTLTSKRKRNSQKK